MLSAISIPPFRHGGVGLPGGGKTSGQLCTLLPAPPQSLRKYSAVFDSPRILLTYGQSLISLSVRAQKLRNHITSPPLIMPPSAPEGSNAAKPAVNASASETNSTNKEPQQKPAAALEEDDEFEDFPVEGLYLCTWDRSRH